MPPAGTYSEWTRLFDLFGQGDDTVIDDMDAASFAMDEGTAQRFCSRAEEAYRKRKQAWLDGFRRSIQSSRLTNVDDFGIVLRNGKQNLLPLVKFVTSKGLPEELKKTLHQDLMAFISEMKKSLKDNVSRSRDEDRKNVERRLELVTAFGMPDHHTVCINAIRSREHGSSNPPASGGRKIIF